MLQKLLIATAVSGLALSGALAQQTPPASPSSPPAATMPDTSAKAPAVDASKAKNQVVTQQAPDQWLASKFKGTDVIGSDNAKIGDVNDVLFDKSGKVEALIIGVGGFLGIGSKDVAFAPSSFEVIPATDKDDMKLKLSMTKEELKQAAEFKRYEKPRTTTGTGGQRPMGTGAPPMGRQ